MRAVKQYRNKTVFEKKWVWTGVVVVDNDRGDENTKFKDDNHIVEKESISDILINQCDS